ncbi:MAG: mechanosensitive ion channel [Planctomycetia bacterium]|nr:mechanosensitive ion channel [Planctomycetia bacterium]
MFLQSLPIFNQFNRRMLAPIMLAFSTLAIIPACVSSGFGEQPLIGPLLGPLDPTAQTSAEASASPARKDQRVADKKHAATEIKDQRQKVAEELRIAQRQLDVARAAGSSSSEPTRPLSRKPELLKKRDTLLAQRQAVGVRHDDALASVARARVRATQIDESLPQSGPPYSFLLLEKCRDSVDTASARIETAEGAVAGARDALKQTRSEVEEKQSHRVLAKEALQNNKNPAAAEELHTALELAELEADVAGERLKLREAELANETLALESNQIRLTTAQAKLEKVQKAARFTRDDLQEHLAELDSAERELTALAQSLGEGSAAARLAEEQWMDARGRLDATPQRSGALKEEVSAWSRARKTQQQRLALATQQLHRVGDMRTAWNRRFAALNERSARDDLDKWLQESQQTLAQLAREVRVDTVRADELRKELITIDERGRTEEGKTPDVARWLERQRQEIQQQLMAFDADGVQSNVSRRLHESLAAEIRTQTAAGSFGDWLHNLWRSLRNVWNFVLTTAGPNESPITVGKIVSGLLLVVLGYFLARWMSRFFTGRLPRRFGMNPNASAALQSLSFYVLVAMFTIVALYYVDVPLTAFTIAGGAVALGVGFGSQNIINNFISGLILLAEQPIRVGDQIQIDGMSARVENIGARSTRVRTGSNQEIIIPNSSFLQNNVINWTLSDNSVRGEVKVGVSYGSDLEEVQRALIAAATSHELVMDKPAPFVWLMDFGSDAIKFELHFWIQIASSSQRRQVESDVRFTIDRIFRERNLSIAFPQGNVHLNTSKPLAIQLVTAPNNSPVPAPFSRQTDGALFQPATAPNNY